MGFVNPTVRIDSDGNWYFGDKRRLHDGACSIVIKRGDLATTSATDLARALRRARTMEMEPERILIDTAPDDEYSPKESVVEPTAFFLLDDGRLGVEVSLTSQLPFDGDDDLWASTEPLIRPLLLRHKVTLVSLTSDRYRSTRPFIHDAVIVVSTRSKTMEDVRRIADQIAALVDAAAAGFITRDAAVDLILGGRADLLVGQAEGPWLDAKSHHYDLTSDKGRISLAQAVGRFANAEEGGIVVVGMDTKHVAGGETIRSVRPVPVDSRTVRRYRQVIASRIFPLPAGLEIHPVEVIPGSGLVVVSIPPQPEELKPFLVHGAIVDGRVEGAFISIVRRSGEDSIPTTAPQIHSALAAGRALLRRGHLRES
jgi:hypothetical protein